jgi:recombinational DNA repair protein RecT
MARKTVIRRAWKYWPVSTEVQERISRAVEIEDSDKPIAAQFEVKSTVDDLESALEAETQAPELETVNPVTGEVAEQWEEGRQ